MKKKIIIISGVLAVVIGLGIGMYQSNASQADPTLNYDEVTSLISSQYPGKITELELIKENDRAAYDIEIVNEDMEYELSVDANSGEILKLKEKRLASNEPGNDEKSSSESRNITMEDEQDRQNNTKTDQQTKVDSREAAQENEGKQEKQQEQKQTVIDPTKAIEIALAEFPGVVESVDLDEEDGRLIYEIEIEAGEVEAEFEIDAMTGEIIVIEIDD